MSLFTINSTVIVIVAIEILIIVVFCIIIHKYRSVYKTPKRLLSDRRCENEWKFIEHIEQFVKLNSPNTARYKICVMDSGSKKYGINTDYETEQLLEVKENGKNVYYKIPNSDIYKLYKANELPAVIKNKLAPKSDPKPFPIPKTMQISGNAVNVPGTGKSSWLHSRGLTDEGIPYGSSYKPIRAASTAAPSGTSLHYDSDDAEPEPAGSENSNSATRVAAYYNLPYSTGNEDDDMMLAMTVYADDDDDYGSSSSSYNDDDESYFGLSSNDIEEQYSYAQSLDGNDSWGL